jgi:RHS repeat-associated protein
VLWTDTQLPFGGSAGALGEIDAENIFTGKIYDQVTELFYFNARWYDPTLGRFISEDPKRNGINWAIYCSNNPINKIDPDGCEDKNFFQAAGDVIGAAASVVWNFGRGAVTAAWNFAVDAVNFGINTGKFVIDGKYRGEVLQGLVSNANNFKELIFKVAADPGKYTELLKAMLGEKFNEFVEASPEHKAYLLGNVAGDIGITILGTKGIDKLIGVIKNSKMVLSITDKISDTAKILDKVEDTAKTIDKIEDTAKTIDKISDAGKVGKSVLGKNAGSGAFRTEQNLVDHFLKHGKEYGNITQADYLSKAQQLINSKAGGDILTKIRTNGDTLFFNKATGDFAVKSSDGFIRTLFKPADGLDYFLKQ